MKNLVITIFLVVSLLVCVSAYSTSNFGNVNVKGWLWVNNSMNVSTQNFNFTGITWLNETHISRNLYVNGNVSIGSPTTTYKLHVKGADDGVIFTRAASESQNIIIYTDASSNRIIANGAKNFVIRNANNEDIRFNINDTDRMIVNGVTGNIGIGTVDPQQKLEVTGTDDVYVQVRSTGVDSTAGIALYNDAKSWVMRTEGSIAGDPFQIREVSANAERLTIIAGGNVGIGTTSPTNKLSVKLGNISLFDASDIERLRIKNDPTNNVFEVGLSSQNYNLVFDSSGANQNSTIFRTSGGIIGAGTERMRITGNGNVGIGTTSPTEQLSVVLNLTAGKYKSEGKVGVNVSGATSCTITQITNGIITAASCI